jgi:predicted DNA-binding protein YlxM (UPF0122 family)
MDKDWYLIKLFSLYGNLLTEHQRDLFNLYYECDLSLGEIAEIHCISRQSVNDALKKSRDILLSTDEKLGFNKKISEINSLIDSAVTEGSDEVKEFAVEISRLLEES